MDQHKASSHRSLKISFGVVFLGHMAGAALGATALYFVSRHLSVVQFGLFSVALAIIRAAPPFTTLGLDTTTMKFISSFLRDGKTAEASRVIRTAFSFRLISACVIAAALSLGAGPLARRVFHAPELAPLLRFASLGVLCMSQFNYFKAVLWSHQEFRRCAGLQVLVDATKLAAILAAVYLGLLTPALAIAAWGLSPLAGLLWRNAGMLRDFLTREKADARTVFDLLGFTKWIFASEISKALFNSIDLFIVARLLGSHSAGIYGLAMNLTYLFPIVTISLKAVLVPHASRLQRRAEYEHYLRRSLATSLGLAACFLPILLVSGKLIPLVFGQRYQAAVPLFNILFLSSGIGALQISLNALLYALHKPFVLAIADFLRILVTAFAAYHGTIRFGIAAPAFVELVVNAAYILTLLAVIRNLLRRLER